MGQMVFVAMSRERARALRDAGSIAGPLGGHAATPSLMAAQDYDESLLEDAEYTALAFAGVAALTEAGEADILRLVLAAELPPSLVQVSVDSDLGAVQVHDLPWKAVQALFSDESGSAAAVASARTAAVGRSVAEAFTMPAVVDVFENHDLLWFAPEELDRLP